MYNVHTNRMLPSYELRKVCARHFTEICMRRMDGPKVQNGHIRCILKTLLLCISICIVVGVICELNENSWKRIDRIARLSTAQPGKYSQHVGHTNFESFEIN